MHNYNYSYTDAAIDTTTTTDINVNSYNHTNNYSDSLPAIPVSSAVGVHSSNSSSNSITSIPTHGTDADTSADWICSATYSTLLVPLALVQCALLVKLLAIAFAATTSSCNGCGCGVGSRVGVRLSGAQWVCWCFYTISMLSGVLAMCLLYTVELLGHGMASSSGSNSSGSGGDGNDVGELSRVYLHWLSRTMCNPIHNHNHYCLFDTGTDTGMLWLSLWTMRCFCLSVVLFTVGVLGVLRIENHRAILTGGYLAPQPLKAHINPPVGLGSGLGSRLGSRGSDDSDCDDSDDSDGDVDTPLYVGVKSPQLHNHK